MAKEFPLAVVIRAVDRITAPLRKMQNGIAAFDNRLRKGWSAFSDRSGVTATVDATKRLWGSLGDVNDRAMTVLRTFGGIAAVGAGISVAVLGTLVNTASEFERFNTILTTIEGSAEKAGQSMQWVSGFAAKTPYELAQVTDAFVKLKAAGMDPASGLLETVGDASSALGKDLMMGVEAIIDAANGENERLKEAFNVRAKIEGNSIRYFYTDLATGAERTAVANRNSRAEITRTLQTILSGNFRGGMDKLSRTWSGMLSNVSDQWERFKLLIMQSGAFDWLTAKLSKLLDKLNQMAESGDLQKLAKEIGEKLTNALEKAWEMGEKFYNSWDEIGAKIKPFVTVFEVLSNTFGSVNVGFATLAAIITMFMLPALIPAIAAVWQLNVALWSNPIGVVVLLVLALVAAFLYFSLKVEDGRIKLTKFGEIMVWLVTTPMRVLQWHLDKIAEGIEHWKLVIGMAKAAWGDLWGYLAERFPRAMGWISDFASKLTSMIPDWAKEMFAGDGATVNVGAAAPGLDAAGAAQSIAQRLQSASEARVTVDFKHLPAGVRVNTEQRGAGGIEVNQGYAFGG